MGQKKYRGFIISVPRRRLRRMLWILSIMVLVSLAGLFMVQSGNGEGRVPADGWGSVFTVNDEWKGRTSAFLSDIKNSLGRGDEQPVVKTGSESMEDKLLRWGISRRPGNVPPQADPGAPELIKKYGGVYIGDTSRKVIYLTFDEGYENGYTSGILDVLKSNGVKAIFFITGPYLKDHQGLVRRMVEEGHGVGNHTVNHPSLPGLNEKEMEEEVLSLDRAFKEKFGRTMKALRPPKGEYSERSLATTQKLGYVNMFWSFAYDDWYRDKSRGADYAYEMVMRNLHPGAVLLLHAVSKDNAQAMDRIIKGAREKGYEFGNPENLY